ncbi:MAG: WYL domain-containing protein [Myxococcales bacterium]|nr:WYL domain-containing protein [Myxococcales bacterium]
MRRLHGIVELLRARRSPVTVAELAQRFSVSERTVFRDLAALRANDVPIDSDTGPTGGVRLARSYHLPPLAITVDEAVAMWVAVKLSEGPAEDRLAAALDKVLGGIPEARRREVQRIFRRIVIGPKASDALQGAGVPPAADIYRTCEQALVNAQVLSLSYVDAGGAASKRTVEPHGLLVLDPVWYLLAHDQMRSAPRTFRLDRIREARLVAGHFDPRDPRTLFPCDPAA